jgi:hypothetical protein
MTFKNYLLGAAALTGAVFVSIPIGDAMFKSFGPTEVRNTKVTSIEYAPMRNDLGMRWGNYTVKCDSLDGKISFTDSEMNDMQINKGDVVDLSAYLKVSVYGMNRGYDGISIKKSN